MSFKRENQRIEVYEQPISNIGNNNENKNNISIPNNVYDKYLEYVYNILLEQLD